MARRLFRALSNLNPFRKGRPRFVLPRRLDVEVLEDRSLMSVVPGDVILNEFRRDGTFNTTEFIEVLLTRDLSAADVQSLFLGDSTSTTIVKNSSYQFTNLASIASTFKAGTLFVLGGTTAIPTQDTAYNPLPGGSDDDWNVQLQPAGGFVTATGTGDFAASDVAWIDTSNAGTTSLDSIAWPATGGGAFAAAAKVRVAAPNNVSNVEFVGNMAGLDITANYAVSTPGSRGLPNGGDNTTFINALRNPSTPALSVSISPDTFSETAGANAATGTVTRTGSLAGDLTVTLMSGDTSEATVPATVTILDNQDSAVFTVAAADDMLDDGTQSVLITASAAGFTSGETTVSVTDDEFTLTPIYTIQGSGSASPLAGSTVTTVGIVVGDFQGTAGLNGFFLQDETGDGDVSTSDGIFVFVPAANSLASINVNPGDRVRVTGRVTEFNTLTEIDFVTEITILASGVSVTPTVVSFPETVNNELERVEGMLITIPETMTAGQNFFQGRFGQVTLSSEGRLFQPTNVFDPGSPEAIALADENARRLLVLDDGTEAQNPNPIPYIGADSTLRAGDTVSGLTGVIDFGSISSTTSIRDYRLQPTLSPVFTRVNSRTAAPSVAAGNLKVASFNVLNYFTNFNLRGANSTTEFERQSDKIVAALLAIDADVLGLIELENNAVTGINPDRGTAIAQLVTRLNAVAGAGTYAFVPDPAFIGTDQIKVGFIYKPGRVIPVGGPVSDPDPVHNRPPVAQTFRLLSNGEKLTVVVNHFKSKSAPAPGDVIDSRDQDQGDGQGAFNYTRTLQAQALLTFIGQLQAASGDPDVLVVGDLNAYAKEDPIRILEQGGLVNQIARYIPGAYSFIFDGLSGYLDHALATASLSASVADVDEWHINADEPSVIDYNTEFKPQDLYTPTPYRSSDHDPVVVSMNLTGPIPSASGTVRFSTFNASLNRNFAGQLIDDLSHPSNPVDAAQALRVQQAKNVAEVIQRVRPDVVLINEFDFDAQGPGGTSLAAQLFRDNFLEDGQNGASPIEYPFVYIAPSNTGIASGFDLNNNGQTVTTPGAPGYGDDALGFGNFPGQFGMVLFSKFEILTDGVRTFQNFLWKDMPGALLPDDPTFPGVDDDFYSDAEKNIFRLSSKSHWDVPILVNGEVIHVLVSHPTPPVFDGPEDRNGRRNHDEIRLFADYITPGAANYLYDDNGAFGGLTPGAKFVIMGDQNADPNDGDSFDDAILQLLNNPRINTSVTPTSEGGPDAALRQGGINNSHISDPMFDTADFADSTPGNLRADYVLPSRHLTISDAQVFWPKDEDPLFRLVGDFNPAIPGGFPTSDHRLVWADLAIPEVRASVTDIDFLGEVTFATGLQFNGTDVGGLSGLAYDEQTGLYYSISDDRSSLDPARFYTLQIDVSDGSLDSGDVTFLDVTTLLQPDATPFPTNSIDFEGIALAPDGSLYISSEGEANPAVRPLVDPAVFQFTLGGLQSGGLDVPLKFKPQFITDSSGLTQVRGVRNNLAFESLTITPDGRYLYTATENALVQDGPAASLADQSPSRIVKYDLKTGQVVAEYVYYTDEVAAPPIPAGSFSTNGLVELLAIDSDGTLLALERSFSTGVGNAVKLYEVRTQDAVDVKGLDNILGKEPDPAASKRLLFDFSTLGIPLDNLEGLALGPKLPDGRQTLIVVSDNNFSSTQFTQFLAFALDIKSIPLVQPTDETPAVVDLDQDELPLGVKSGDIDDPAVYVHPTDPSKSFILGTLKEGGLQVYDLKGNVLQTVAPDGVRYNNVDLIYGFKLKHGQTADLAVVSDRENDTIVIFKIDPNTGALTDITGKINHKQPLFEGDGSDTAYGLAAYVSPASGKSYVFVSRREGPQIRQLELTAKNGRVDARVVRTIELPVPAGLDPADALAEAMVADREAGFLYVAQEQVGILKYFAEPSVMNLPPTVVAAVGDNLEADAEGLTIYYAANGTGYLIASSQGDSTFNVYRRQGNNAFISKFAVGASQSAGVDGAEETDGAEVINVPLGPDYPFGILVVQDGNDNPPFVIDDDGQLENAAGNFKFVPWEHVAAAFLEPLIIDTASTSPRSPTPDGVINGVAAGDTGQHSAVLWVSSNLAANVKFEVFRKANFTSRVFTHDGLIADPLLPVNTTVAGLQAGKQYYYRVTVAGSYSKTGTFRTSAQAGSFTGLKIVVSGDWRGELAPHSKEIDIVMGGSSNLDGNTARLLALRGVWAGPGSYLQRVQRVRSEFGLAMLDDGASDVLNGEQGRDWFFAALAHDLLDAKADEEKN